MTHAAPHADPTPTAGLDDTPEHAVRRRLVELAREHGAASALATRLTNSRHARWALAPFSPDGVRREDEAACLYPVPFPYPMPRRADDLGSDAANAVYTAVCGELRIAQAALTLPQRVSALNHYLAVHRTHWIDTQLRKELPGPDDRAATAAAPAGPVLPAVPDEFADLHADLQARVTGHDTDQGRVARILVFPDAAARLTDGDTDAVTVADPHGTVIHRAEVVRQHARRVAADRGEPVVYSLAEVLAGRLDVQGRHRQVHAATAAHRVARLTRRLAPGIAHAAGEHARAAAEAVPDFGHRYLEWLEQGVAAGVDGGDPAAFDAFPQPFTLPAPLTRHHVPRVPVGARELLRAVASDRLVDLDDLPPSALYRLAADYLDTFRAHWVTVLLFRRRRTVGATRQALADRVTAMLAEPDDREPVDFEPRRPGMPCVAVHSRYLPNGMGVGVVRYVYLDGEHELLVVADTDHRDVVAHPVGAARRALFDELRAALRNTTEGPHTGGTVGGDHDGIE